MNGILPDTLAEFESVLIRAQRSPGVDSPTKDHHIRCAVRGVFELLNALETHEIAGVVRNCQPVHQKIVSVGRTLHD